MDNDDNVSHKSMASNYSMGDHEPVYMGNSTDEEEFDEAFWRYYYD